MNKHTLSNAVRVSLVGLGLGVAFGNGLAHAAGSITASPTGNGTEVAEAGKGDYYTLKLDTAPTANVTVTFALDGQLMAQPQAVIFTPDNYSVPVAITVSAVDDKAPEGPHSGTISHNLSSQDPQYNMANQSPVTASIADNDLATIVISKASSELTEGGAQDSYTVSLSAKPVADVTVGVQRLSASAAQAEASPASVTFTSTDWQPRTITLTAVDDAKADGTRPEEFMHTVSSADTAYTENSLGEERGHLVVTVKDNDTAGILASKSSLRLIEGGTASSYTLALSTQPSTNVSLDLTVGDGTNPEKSSQLTISPAHITFTSLNYSTPQTVTVHAVDDPVGEGRQSLDVQHRVAESSDAVYLQVGAPKVGVEIVDDDVPAVVVAESGESSEVAEGGAQDSYTLVLTTRPVENVSIDVKPGSQLAAGPNRVTFTPDNFDTPQTVTLTAVNDLVVEDTRQETVTHAIVSEDFGYAGGGVQVDNVVATVTDNDRRSVLVTQTGGATSVTEGAETGDVYSIGLTAQPAGTVTVTLDADAFLLASPSTVTFTADSFGPQLVTVTAADDDMAQGARTASIRHSVSSTDAGYDAMPVATVSVSIADNDVAGLLLQETDGSTRVIEGGAGDSYTLRLATRPQSDVTVQIGAGSQLQANPATVTFTPDDYDQPRSVALAALDDADIEGERFETVTHQVESSDSAYANGLSMPELTVGIEDNDETVSPPVEEPPVEEPPVVEEPKTRTGGGSLDLADLMVFLFAGLAGLCRLARRLNLG